MFYLKNLVLIVFLFLTITLLFVWLSPLDYTNLYVSNIHFVLVLGFANWYFFLVYRKTKQYQTFKVYTSIFTPIILTFTFVYFVLNTDKQLIETTHIPGTNKVISTNFYTLFMMGNPRIDLSVGYSFFYGNLVWRPNVFTRNGLGDSFEEPSEFEIPEKFLHREGIFLIQEESCLFDYFENKIYKIKKNDQKRQ